jgi:transposase
VKVRPRCGWSRAGAAVDGMFDDHHGELAALLLDQIAVPDAKIAQLGARAAELAAAMPAAWGIDADGTTGPGAGTGPDAPALNAAARLAEIPGISENLARAIIAETGLDMTRFPTAGHLVSWAGLCPSARQSRPRTRAAKKGQGDTWLRGSLGQAAIGAARTATFLGERYARIARRRGKAKAQAAVARSILVIIWHLLADPAARYTDLGYGYHQARTEIDRKPRNHIRQIQALGFAVTLTRAAQPHTTPDQARSPHQAPGPVHRAQLRFPTFRSDDMHRRVEWPPTCNFL